FEPGRERPAPDSARRRRTRLRGTRRSRRPGHRPWTEAGGSAQSVRALLSVLALFIRPAGRDGARPLDRRGADARNGRISGGRFRGRPRDEIHGSPSRRWRRRLYGRLTCTEQRPDAGTAQSESARAAPHARAVRGGRKLTRSGPSFPLANATKPDTPAGFVVRFHVRRLL